MSQKNRDLCSCSFSVKNKLNYGDDDILYKSTKLLLPCISSKIEKVETKLNLHVSELRKIKTFFYISASRGRLIHLKSSECNVLFDPKAQNDLIDNLPDIGFSLCLQSLFGIFSNRFILSIPG